MIGWQNHVLRVRVRARPERGQANEAVRRVIAKTLGLPAGCVIVVRGATSRDKLVQIDAIDEEELRGKLGASPGSSRSGIMKWP